MSKTYTVVFRIEVDAENDREACELAWQRLIDPCAMLPVGEVTVFPKGKGKTVTVDIQELEEQKEKP